MSRSKLSAWYFKFAQLNSDIIKKLPDGRVPPQLQQQPRLPLNLTERTSPASASTLTTTFLPPTSSPPQTVLFSLPSVSLPATPQPPCRCREMRQKPVLDNTAPTPPQKATRATIPVIHSSLGSSRTPCPTHGFLAAILSTLWLQSWSRQKESVPHYRTALITHSIPFAHSSQPKLRI